MDLEMGLGWIHSSCRLLGVLSGVRLGGVKELIEATGLSSRAVWNGFRRCRKKGLILRCDRLMRERERVLRG